MSLRAAVVFLTRVPIPLRRPASPNAIVPWFPVVGVLVGSAVAGTAIGLDHLLPPFASAAVAVLVGVVITGAFHEDGLADSADALAGGHTVERRREILKDSRLGTYGTAALCGSIVVRIAAVSAALPVGWQPTLAVVVSAHTLGRVVGPVLLVVSAPAGGGLATDFAASVTRSSAWIAAAIGVLVTGFATGWWTFALVAFMPVAAAVTARVASRSFGGSNGDLLGAAEQLVEIAVLLTGAALAASHTPWWG